MIFSIIPYSKNDSRARQVHNEHLALTKLLTMKYFLLVYFCELQKKGKDFFKYKRIIKYKVSYKVKIM